MPRVPVVRLRVYRDKVVCPNGSWVMNDKRVIIHPGTAEEKHIDVIPGVPVTDTTAKQALLYFQFEASFDEFAEVPPWVENISYIICNDTQKEVKKAELDAWCADYKVHEIFDVLYDPDEQSDWPWLIRNRRTSYVSAAMIAPLDDGGNVVGVIIEESRLLD